MGNSCNAMKYNIIIAVSALSVLTACGPGPQRATAEKPAAAPAKASETPSEYDSTGSIVAVNGLTLTLDHDGAIAADLPAGREDFRTYAEVLAEAPLTPGQRVTFRFRKTETGLELSELKAR